MPPKKVAPASAKTNGPKSAKSRGGAAAKEAKAAAAAAEETKVPEPSAPPQHENDMYNEYDIDGHRIKSPEPKSRWGKLRRRAAKAWRESACYAKKKQFHEWREKRRYIEDQYVDPKMQHWFSVLCFNYDQHL